MGAFSVQVRLDTRQRWAALRCVERPALDRTSEGACASSTIGSRRRPPSRHCGLPGVLPILKPVGQGKVPRLDTR